jgi:hypothetical protein
MNQSNKLNQLMFSHKVAAPKSLYSRLVNQTNQTNQTSQMRQCKS